MRRTWLTLRAVVRDALRVQRARLEAGAASRVTLGMAVTLLAYALWPTWERSVVG